MTPQRAQALEAELRRLADRKANTYREGDDDQDIAYRSGMVVAYRYAADLLRAAMEEG